MNFTDYLHEVPAIWHLTEIDDPDFCTYAIELVDVKKQVLESISELPGMFSTHFSQQVMSKALIAKAKNMETPPASNFFGGFHLSTDKLKAEEERASARAQAYAHINQTGVLLDHLFHALQQDLSFELFLTTLIEMAKGIGITPNLLTNDIISEQHQNNATPIEVIASLQKAKQVQELPNLFTVFYYESPSDSKVYENLSDTTLHTSMASAYQTLWSYVSARIPHAASEVFLEECSQFNLDPSDFATDDEVKALLNSVRPDQYPEIIEWYFTLMDDEDNEAYYQITSFEHNHCSG